MTENSISAQASDEPMRVAFETWARDPVRSEKLPLERWPENGGYKDSRTYIAFYGWKSALANQAATPRATAEVENDAARYRWLLDNYARGDGYTDIDAALNDGEPEKYLSPAIDAAIAATKQEVK